MRVRTANVLGCNRNGKDKGGGTMQVKTSSSVISAVLLVVLVAGIGWAAPITSITTTPGLVDEDTPVSVETTVTSISTAGATYSSLYGASSVECASGGISWWPLDRDDLSSASSKNLFLEGLSLTTAVANKPFKAYFTHPAVTASSVFFLFEVGGNDSFTLYPIDAAGSTLGTYELVVGSSDFGVKVMTTGGLRDS
ncbi:MAG: hypothetical protein K9N51_14125, partial [Candidatus Pacebacteria bacterium]|nr:hypothetical protein [Candidatus Paceibacterota bacterium]